MGTRWRTRSRGPERGGRGSPTWVAKSGAIWPSIALHQLGGREDCRLHVPFRTRARRRAAGPAQGRVRGLASERSAPRSAVRNRRWPVGGAGEACPAMVGRRPHARAALPPRPRPVSHDAPDGHARAPRQSVRRGCGNRGEGGGQRMRAGGSLVRPSGDVYPGSSTDSSARTRVPLPGGLSIMRWPPTAATRSSRPPKPVP
jgi:hypothetical protein